jgi:putative Mg2+ transporter-C (MgtC) family protein
VLEPTEILLRLGAATLAGALLGLDRELAAKPIGIRTLALVSLGSAAVCIAATDQEIFTGEPDALSRVMQGAIQGVLSGIGFLGAGVVLQQPSEQRVKYLTSAATVWVTACLGIACGIGAWWVVGGATALALFLLVVIHPIDRWLERRARRKRVEEDAQPPAAG